MSELLLAPVICALLLGGTSEVTHGYSVGYDIHRIRVDCETPTHVIEIGLDKRSSIDSVHQAVFAASLTGLSPMVVIIDTDGRESAYEYQIRTVSRLLGIEYRTYDRDFLVRQQMGAYLRSYRTPQSAPDS